MKIGLYPGSFDPFTIGHLEVLQRASRMFDKVVAGILQNSQKKSVFTVSERQFFIEAAAKEAGITNVEARYFNGLTVEFAQEVGASFIVRGLRAVTDFEYEFSLNAMNRRLAPEIDTIYVMASPEHAFLSSGMVREVASYGGSIKGLVPDVVETIIAERLLR